MSSGDGATATIHLIAKKKIEKDSRFYIGQ